MTHSIEDKMRPGKSSHAGFLGANERLDDLLKNDDETVRKLGLTHAQIADRIEYFLQAVHTYPTHPGTLIDGKYKITGTVWRGSQECPWEGTTTYGGADYTVENTSLQERVDFPGLIVHLIRDHYFYEGKESPYRVDPEQIVRVLEIK